MFALHERLGVYSIMAGFVAGELLMFLFLWKMARHTFGFRFRPMAEGGREAGRFLSAASFYITCAALSSFNPVLDRMMASWTGVGGVSLIQYMATLQFVFFSVLAVGFEAVLASYWSNEFHKADSRKGFHRETLRVTGRVLALSTLACTAIFLIRGPIVELFFHWSRVPEGTVPTVTALFGLNIFSLIPTMLIIVLQQHFFVQKRTNELLIAHALRFVLNVVLDLAFIRLFGLTGIVLSTLVSNWVLTVTLFVLFRRGR
jgi:putative peptidoglycan lipid II flippase